MLGERVEIATKMSQTLFDRVTSAILAGASTPRPPARQAGGGPPSFSVLPPPGAASQPERAKPPVIAPPRKPVVQPAQIIELPPGEFPSEIKVLNANGRRELILLVDDEMEVSELASEMLAMEGYRIIMARDGFEALRIYQQIGRQIGLVILDFFLPVMDGDAVFDELRQLNPNVNVVLSSGFAEQSKLGAMLAQGLRGFVPKPYTRERLLEQVRSTLDAGRGQ
jgi:CheY-like chemotaxis protein